MTQFLKVGDKGPEVLHLSQILEFLGYYSEDRSVLTKGMGEMLKRFEAANHHPHPWPGVDENAEAHLNGAIDWRVRNPNATSAGWLKKHGGKPPAHLKLAAPVPPSPQKSRLFADVSGNNPSVDVAEYAKHFDVLEIKLTEGSDFQSDTGAARWAEAGKHGLIRVGYCFNRPSQTSPKQECGYFVAYAKRCGLKAGDVLEMDWEDPGFEGRNGDAYVRDFIAEGKRLGVKIGSLYSYGPYLSSTLTRIPAGVGYHHAAYISNPLGNVPGFSRGALWADQFTNGVDGHGPHSADGIGSCDMNELLITESALRARGQ